MALIGKLSFCDVADMPFSDEFVDVGLDVMARTNKEGTAVNCLNSCEVTGKGEHDSSQGSSWQRRMASSLEGCLEGCLKGRLCGPRDQNLWSFCEVLMDSQAGWRPDFRGLVAWIFTRRTKWRMSWKMSGGDRIEALL